MTILLKSCYIAPFIIFFLSSWFFLHYYVIVGEKYDKFNKPLLYKTLTPWQVLHVVLYTIAGYFFPHCVIEFFIIGLVWEMYEKMLGSLTKDYTWWSGYRIHDIMYNLLGLVIGFTISML